MTPRNAVEGQGGCQCHGACHGAPAPKNWTYSATQSYRYAWGNRVIVCPRCDGPAAGLLTIFCSYSTVGHSRNSTAQQLLAALDGRVAEAMVMVTDRAEATLLVSRMFAWVFVGRWL